MSAPNLELVQLVDAGNYNRTRSDFKFGLSYGATPHSVITYPIPSWSNDPITSLTLTGLPPGMSFTSYLPAGGTANGQSDSFELIGISGTPTQVGDYLLELNATGAGGTSTKTFPIKVRVGNPTPLPTQSLTATAGQPFSATLAVADSVNAPFGTYRVHTYWADGKEYPDFSGSGDYWIYGGSSTYIFPTLTLPPGLTLDRYTGAITGTPVLSGQKSTEIAIAYSTQNAAGYWGDSPKSSSTTLSISIAPGAASALYTVPSGLKGTDNISLTPSWNDTGAVWSATGLPAGVSILSSTGEITGTILSKGAFSVTVAVVYDGTTYTESFVLDVAPGAPAIKPDQTISLIYGEAKTAHLRNLLEDPSEVYSDWSSFTVSGLPSWAVFDSGGSYTGSDGVINYPSPPPERGTWTADLTVTGAGGSATGTFTFEVGFGPPIIEPGQAFTGSYLSDFSGDLLLVDVANRPHGSFYVDPQAPMPPGLDVTGYGFNTVGPGRLSGTPTGAGFFTTRIKPLNAPDFQFNDTDYETVTFDIAYGVPQITRPFSLPTGKVGDAYSSATPALTDSANRPVTAWSATGLPAWASFDETTGEITGTPQDTGSHTVTLTATGPGGTDSVSASLVVAIGAPIITSGQSFTGKVGEAFTAQVVLEDALDRPADTWSATSLPSGLTLDTSTGEITGTPTSSGAISATITASNAAGSDTKSVDFTITAGTPIITPSQSFSTKVGAAFSATPTLTDATNRPVTSWSAAGLPGWLSLDTTTGKLTGTPQDAETLTFSLTATGPGGSDTESVEVVVALGAPIIDPATFTGKVGEAFTGGFTLSDAADRPATEWAASNLPAGLSIDAATGAISGTPTTRADTVAVIVATGPGGTGVPLSVPFSVTAGAPIITAGQFFTATQGQGFSTTPALTDAANRPASSWSASGLPSWAVIDGATGAISGTPSSTSPVSLTLTATGPGGTSEPQTYIITVTTSSTGGGGDPEEPAIPMISLVSGQTFTATLGQAFSATPALLTGTAATWHASGLPDWATINQTTGQITGNPTYTGTATVLITVQEASGVSAADYISITAVSWNTLELYIDPRARKFLSKANSKYPLSKIAMKRYDRMPFQLAFVDGSTAFSVPSSYEVTVGLKKNYGDTTYLAFATNTNGVLELNTDAIEAVFADEPDIVPALFEVRWQDTSSAFRTATLAAEIQNSVIRGEGNPPPPPPPPEDQAPIIRLYGSNPMTVDYGSTFTDPGARVDDDIDAARNITGTGTVDTSVVGTYTLTYTATDSAGNAATPITRTVNVFQDQAPVITLNGSNPLIVDYGSTFTDPGARVDDDIDAARNITGTGTVDTSVVDTYTLTYTATDSAGNSATPITRTVYVVAVPPTYTPPTLSWSASGQQTWEIGTNVSTQLSTLWSQNDAGAVTAFRIVDGSGTVLEDTSVLSPYQHDFQLLENTTLTASVDYAEGPQKYDSAGNISGTPIPAGTKTSTGIVFTVFRAAFVGISGSGVPYNSATVRAISAPLQGLAKGSTYTLNIPVGTRRIAVAYPATIGSLASVRYVEWSNYDVTDTFTFRSVSVAGANGAAPILYNVYYYIPAIPFDSPATYVVTI